MANHMSAGVYFSQYIYVWSSIMYIYNFIQNSLLGNRREKAGRLAPIHLYCKDKMDNMIFYIWSLSFTMQIT